MIPLVINHLMSTCFHGAQNPADRVTLTSRQTRAVTPMPLRPRTKSSMAISSLGDVEVGARS